MRQQGSVLFHQLSQERQKRIEARRARAEQRKIKSRTMNGITEGGQGALEEDVWVLVHYIN